LLNWPNTSHFDFKADLQIFAKCLEYLRYSIGAEALAGPGDGTFRAAYGFMFETDFSKKNKSQDASPSSQIDVTIRRTFSVLILCSFFTFSVVGRSSDAALGEVTCHEIITPTAAELVEDSAIEKQTLDQIALLPQDVVDQIKQGDDEALDIVARLFLDRKQMDVELGRWLTDLESRDLSIVEHTAVSYILRNGTLIDYPRKDFEHRAEAVLSRSWTNLTGEKWSGNLEQRLPKRVMKGQSRQARVFERGSFESEDPKRLEPIRVTDRAIIPSTFLIALGFRLTNGWASYAPIEVPGKVIAGALMGFAIVSVMEYLTHVFLAHTSVRNEVEKIQNKTKSQHLKNFLKKMEKPVEFINTAFLHHTAHHKAFESDYTKAFAKSGEKDRMDKWLSRFGDLANIIIKEKYGLTLGIQGRLIFMGNLLPAQLAISAITGFDPILSASILVVGLMYPFNSADSHPYLHKKRTQALAEAPPLLRAYMKTEIYEASARRHELHHFGQVDYNLAPFNLGDRIFGKLREPNMLELLRLRRDESIGAYWGP
jgi:hypothetical protein